MNSVFKGIVGKAAWHMYPWGSCPICCHLMHPARFIAPRDRSQASTPAQLKADVTSPESEEALLFRLAEQRMHVGICPPELKCVSVGSRVLPCHSL